MKKTEKPKRKPYDKPVIESTESLEEHEVTCAKADAAVCGATTADS